MADYAITWVRHGELISQLIEHANDDWPWTAAKEKLKNYEAEFNAYRKTIIEKEINNYKRFHDKLVKHYEGEEKVKLTEIQLKDNKLLLDYPIINIVDDVYRGNLKDQPSDTWFLNSFFSKQVSPSTWYFTPTLDSVGVLESKKFGTDFLEKNKDKYDTIICSPTVRTIMTALYALKAAGISGKEIIIIPYINEKNITANKGVEERANVGIPVEILDKVVALIDTATGNIGPNKYTINMDLYKAEGHTNPKTYSFGGNFKRAKEIIDNEIIANGAKNILAFVHGNFIRFRLNEYNENVNVKKIPVPRMPYNCSAYKLKYKINSDDITENVEALYVDNDTRIRDNIEKIIDNDGIENNRINDDECSLEPDKLRGKINTLWVRHIDNPASRGGKKRKTKRRSKLKKRRKSKKRTNKNKRR
jgi:broad specificity phosphatase PhoE